MQRVVLRFIGMFGGLLALYFLVTADVRMSEDGLRSASPWLISAHRVQDGFRRGFMERYHREIALTAGGILCLIGQEARVSDRVIHSPQTFAVSVTAGCDAVEPSLLFLAALLSLPVRWRAKLAGLIGLLAISGLNILRVATLWLIGLHWPSALDVVHFLVWPFVFVLFTTGLFAMWCRWALLVRHPPRAEIANG